MERYKLSQRGLGQRQRFSYNFTNQSGFSCNMLLIGKRLQQLTILKPWEIGPLPQLRDGP